jgi:hypothetical protein
MPKHRAQEVQGQTQAFNREEWLKLVRERIMQTAWGSGRLWTDGVITLEVVRVGESGDVMIRLRTQNVKNAIKLTRKEHVSGLLALAEAVARNENNLREKLEALREVLRTGRGATEEEF